MQRTIKNCSLQKKYGEAGLEEGMCAGLRTEDGEGEPCDTCKECKLQYQYEETHS